MARKRTVFTLLLTRHKRGGNERPPSSASHLIATPGSWRSIVMRTPSTGDSAPMRCRRLEGDLDSKLAQLSRQEDSSSGAAVGLIREIETQLQDLEQVNDQMSREAMDSPGGTATAMHKLQRHREILHDFQQEFARSRAQLRQATERSQLLSSVRETISEHRYAASQASDALLRERNAIAASGRAADEVLGQAAATRDALNAQRGGFGSMSGKLGALSALAPQIDSLISAISRRHKRDKIILAVTFGVCTGLLLLYGFGLGG